MSTLANAAGSGAGLVAIIIAMAFTAFLLPHMPGFVRPWAERGVIVVMWAGGSALAVTTLGSWGRWLISHIAGLLGGLAAPIPHVVLIGVLLFLLLGVLVSLIWAPSAATGMVAAVLPLLLGLVAGGVLHQVYMVAALPGQQLASALNSWIGG